MKRGEKRKRHTPSWGRGGEREEGSGVEGLKTNSHPPLEGSEGKKKSQDGEKRACVCGGGGEGGVRGAKLCLGRRQQAGHPGRRRCEPGRVAAARVRAGGGARCTVTGSCAPWPRGDIHWPAGPGSASAPRAAHGSAAAQGPRAAPRFAPSYFGGQWETAGGRLCVDGGLRACGPKSLRNLFLRLLCALTGQSLEISEE